MLALFGLFVCIGLNAPWWVFVLGFSCLLLDHVEVSNGSNQ
jgi:hypothetical protein